MFMSVGNTVTAMIMFNQLKEVICNLQNNNLTLQYQVSP